MKKKFKQGCIIGVIFLIIFSVKISSMKNHVGELAIGPHTRQSLLKLLSWLSYLVNLLSSSHQPELLKLAVSGGNAVTFVLLPGPYEGGLFRCCTFICVFFFA